ncbi:hypothetical protein GCM10020367_49170 [Streptomyces sannanensis]|uniref:Uncharacterized protein n=1 Tax=Streptomyces sannanensis TaxID=285536 RepID=A0ABP6SGY5_9ACTN
MTQNSPPLVLPPGLTRAMAMLQDKDRHRLDDAVTRLHTVNGRLWDTEDRVRGALLSAAQVADCKREIDQLNAERNALAERADEVLGSLADAGRAGAPLHTETLASVVDRLSVLTLRIWHSERAAARDELARRRVPALHGQREELCAALDALVSDVVAGRRRLPVPARFKLYGRDDAAPAEIKPSRHLRRVIAFGGLSECGKSTSAEFVRRSLPLPEGITAIVTSPIPRARQTATLVSHLTGLPIVATSGLLAEWRAPSIVLGRTAETYPPAYRAWRARRLANPSLRCEDGESLTDLHTRARHCAAFLHHSAQRHGWPSTYAAKRHAPVRLCRAREARRLPHTLRATGRMGGPEHQHPRRRRADVRQRRRAHGRRDCRCSRCSSAPLPSPCAERRDWPDDRARCGGPRGYRPRGQRGGR